MLSDSEALAALQAYGESFVIWRDDTKAVAHVFPLPPETPRIDMLQKLSHDYGGPVAGRFVGRGEFAWDMIDRWRLLEEEADVRRQLEAKAKAEMAAIPLDVKLGQLADCGISYVASVFNRADVRSEFHDTMSYLLLLSLLGSLTESEPFVPISDDVRYFYNGQVFSESAYQDFCREVFQLFHRIGRFTDITATFSQNDIQLSFLFNGMPELITIPRGHDDPLELLAIREISAYVRGLSTDFLLYCSLNEAEDFILVCQTAQNVSKLRELTGVELVEVV